MSSSTTTCSGPRVEVQIRSTSAAGGDECRPTVPAAVDKCDVRCCWRWINASQEENNMRTLDPDLPFRAYVRKVTTAIRGVSSGGRGLNAPPGSQEARNGANLRNIFCRMELTQQKVRLRARGWTSRRASAPGRRSRAG